MQEQERRRIRRRRIGSGACCCCFGYLLYILIVAITIVLATVTNRQKTLFIPTIVITTTIQLPTTESTTTHLPTTTPVCSLNPVGPPPTPLSCGSDMAWVSYTCTQDDFGINTALGQMNMLTGELQPVGQMIMTTGYRVDNILMSPTNQLYGIGGLSPTYNPSILYFINKNNGIATQICNQTNILVPQQTFGLGFDNTGTLYMRTQFQNYYTIDLTTCATGALAMSFQASFAANIFNDVLYQTYGPVFPPLSHVVLPGTTTVIGPSLNIDYISYSAPAQLFPYRRSNNQTALWTMWTNAWPVGTTTEYFGIVNVTTGVVTQQMSRPILEYVYGATSPCWYNNPGAMPLSKKTTTNYANFYMTANWLDQPSTVLFLYNPNTMVATPIGFQQHGLHKTTHCTIY